MVVVVVGGWVGGWVKVGEWAGGAFSPNSPR